MSEQNKQSEIVNELNKLGENLGNLLRGIWESDERKSLERELTTGLDQLSKKLSETADNIRNDAYVNNVKKEVKDALDTARVPQIFDEIQNGIVETLKKVNDDLSKRPAPAHEATAETVGESKPE
jgi:ElaB/YqjD/DUF883 family membrane-anchored ribosome-binding protein